MTILALDTTGTACSAAICTPDRVYAEVFTDLAKNHSVMLMPMIDEVFTKCKMGVGDLDYIAVTSGPGSFTGLRIGAATAKSMGHAAAKEIIPVPTLTALAYNVYSEKVVVPIMDARRNQVYTAFYNWENLLTDTDSDNSHENFLPQPRTEFMAEDITAVLKKLENLAPAIFTGDACRIYSDIITKAGHVIAPATTYAVRASAVGLIAIKLLSVSGSVGYHEFTPFYLRLSQAERELNNKENDGTSKSEHSN